jgi:hypothetical protein
MCGGSVFGEGVAGTMLGYKDGKKQPLKQKQAKDTDE